MMMYIFFVKLINNQATNKNENLSVFESYRNRKVAIGKTRTRERLSMDHAEYHLYTHTRTLQLSNQKTGNFS